MASAKARPQQDACDRPGLTAIIADNLEFVFGKVGDLRLVLGVLSISVGDDPENPVLGLVGQALNRAMSNCCSLAVAGKHLQEELYNTEA